MAKNDGVRAESEVAEWERSGERPKSAAYSLLIVSRERGDRFFVDDQCSLYDLLLRGIGHNMLNKFLSLHILTINRVITLPTVSSGCSKLYCQSGEKDHLSRNDY